MEKSKVLIQILIVFRQFGDVLSFLYARRLRGYTATKTILEKFGRESISTTKITVKVKRLKGEAEKILMSSALDNQGWD